MATHVFINYMVGFSNKLKTEIIIFLKKHLKYYTCLEHTVRSSFSELSSKCYRSNQTSMTDYLYTGCFIKLINIIC